MIKLIFKSLYVGGTKGIIPGHKRESDAGWDLYSTREAIMFPNIPQTINTNIAVQAVFDDTVLTKEQIELAKKLFKFEFKVDGCSGNAKIGLYPVGGVIDQGYIGNIGITLVNSNRRNISIKAGDKIGQLIPLLIPRVNQQVTILKDDEEFEQTDRGTKGFGSSGGVESKINAAIEKDNPPFVVNSKEELVSKLNEALEESSESADKVFSNLKEVVKRKAGRPPKNKVN